MIANAFVYDTGGRLARRRVPVGPGNTGNGTTGTFGFDSNTGQPTSMTWNGPASSLLTSDAVTRTKGGRIRDQNIDGTDPHVGDNFLYDTAGRLTDAWVPGRSDTYAFAASGGCGINVAAGKNTNRTSLIVDGGTPVTYCYDHADRLTSTTEAGVSTISYDAHGNSTAIFGETHVYDSEDRHVKRAHQGVHDRALRARRRRSHRRAQGQRNHRLAVRLHRHRRRVGSHSRRNRRRVGRDDQPSWRHAADRQRRRQQLGVPEHPR